MPETMKYFNRFILIFFSLLAILPAYAQQNQQIGCVEPGLRLQAHEMKHQFKEQGFEIMRDAMIHMADREPFSVVADLKKGVFYQLIFIGNTRAIKLALEMYNQKEERIDTRVSNTAKYEPNYISFSFTPETSGRYMFSLVQRVKQKKFCGSFTIMELKKDTKQE